MLTSKLLIASLLGGAVLFIWGALSHMVLGLGEASIKPIPNERAVLTAMQDNIREPGFYFFPGMESSPNMTKEDQEAAMKRWEEKYSVGPYGILIYHPDGTQPLSPKQLLIELLSDILAAFLAAFLLARALGGLSGFGGRVLFVTLLGLFAWMAIEIAYWNWYGFPFGYAFSSLIDQIVGFFLVGLVLATMIKKAQPVS
ncbi:MAG: hypothetical protein HY707_06560 [Ignavibacteriae bacterium]|nr:hypothetical protein [Ignavibacteriota bacterium]